MSHEGYRLGCALVSGLFVTTAISTLLHAVGPSASQPSPAPNPHWSADGCQHCHQVEGGRAQKIAPGDIDAICLTCHDGQRAKREAHPIGRTFAGKDVVRPEGWPATDGKIGCTTCHDVLQACHRNRPRPVQAAAFVRGLEVGKLLDFCVRCHLELKEHQVYNVHIMLNKDDSITRRACQFCHHVLLDDRDRRARTGQAELRYDAVTLCRSCHMEHIDYFAPGHVGAKASVEMRGYMVAFEQTPPNQQPDPKLIKQAVQTGREPTRLPLADVDTVVCSTCHNPHQEGLFPPDSVLAYGAMQTGQRQVDIRLRGLGKEFCFACHNK